MSKLPERFIIPKDRIPRAWSQGAWNCCVSASITKCIEVDVFAKTGRYINMSVGYTYAKHSRPDKTQGGMDYDYAMKSLMSHGTVPEEMFPIIDEIPDIMDKLNAHPDRDKINKEAEKTKIKNCIEFPGNIYFYDRVKEFLYEKQMPLFGNMVGRRHCTVIVGWDGDKLLYHDHKGSDRLTKGRFNHAYYIETGIEEEKDMAKEFKDVKADHWAKKYVDKVVEEGDMKGVSEDEFDIDGNVTRGQLAAVICRLKYGME